MENQHQKITGYRDLTQAEIDLMNEIKAEGERLEALLKKVDTALNDDHLFPLGANELKNPNTNPHRWIAIARTDLQTGLMALTRAVARPTSF